LKIRFKTLYVIHSDETANILVWQKSRRTSSADDAKTVEGQTLILKDWAILFYDSEDWWALIQEKVSLKEGQNYFIGKRDHVQYRRAIMAVRFTDYFVGTQFILKQIL
jgi:hypothetical protein